MIGHTGQVIAEMILGFLEKYGIDICNCRGQSYDNASNMSGKYISVQTIIKQQIQYAEFIHVQLILSILWESSVECSPVVVRFLDIIQKLYTFLSGSTYRWRLLCEKLKSLGLPVVKRLCNTRWSVRYEAVDALHKGYTTLCELFLSLASDIGEKVDCRNEASLILKKLGELDFAILLTFGKQF